MRTMRRLRKPLALQQHNFVERGNSETTIQVDTEASAVGLFKEFNIDQMWNATYYKELFEYYKLNKVVVTFRYKSTPQPASLSGGTQPFFNELNPLIYFKVDHNDITADTLLTLKESTRTRTKQLTNNESEFSIVLKPAVQAEAYKSAIASTYVPKWGQWLSTNDGSVPHYGLKCYVVGYRDANYNPGKIAVSYKYYVSFKNND